MPHQCTNCDRTFPDGSKEMLSGCPDCGGNKFRYLPSTDRAGGGSTEGNAPAGDRDPPADPGGESPPSPDPTGGSVANAVRGATTTVRDWVDRRGDDAPATDRPDRGEDAVPGRPAEAADADGAVDPGDPDPAESTAGEDAAQASARSSVVGPDELPGRSSDPGESGDPAPSEWPTPGSADAGPEADPSVGDPDSPSPGGPDATPDSPTDGPSPVDERSSAGERSPASERSPAGDPGGSEGEPDDGVADRPGTGEGTPDIAELRRELDDQFESIKIVEPGQYELNLMELYDREEYIISLMEDGRYAIEVPETWRDTDR